MSKVSLKNQSCNCFGNSCKLKVGKMAGFASIGRVEFNMICENYVQIEKKIRRHV